ncbi:MAG: hypothetical protein JXR56_01470 [Candidatus Cloacimonetes bacterium]|nr:hypothetical protein [Candidatus Cloacimonadota bacterium]
MLKKHLIVFILTLVSLSGFSLTLKRAYDLAIPANGFDKYITLQTGETYTGGIYIGQTFDDETDSFVGDYGLSTKIIGNGAVLDLQHEEITVAYTEARFEISDCVIINGNIRFVGNDSGVNNLYPSGLVEYVTFYNTDDYGIRTLACGNDITIRRNIFFNAIYTGDDFLQYNSQVNEFLTTGVNVAISQQNTYNPIAQIYDNWSFFSRDSINQDDLYHFSMFCDYG